MPQAGQVSSHNLKRPENFFITELCNSDILMELLHLLHHSWTAQWVSEFLQCSDFTTGMLSKLEGSQNVVSSCCP